jgi:hypothetical protein
MADNTTRPCKVCGRPIRLKSPKDRTWKCARCKRQTANASARARRTGSIGKRTRRLGCAFNLSGSGFSRRSDDAPAVGGAVAVNSDFYRGRKTMEEL